MNIRTLNRSFFVLSAICMLNLNGVVLMSIGIPQAASPFLLFSVVIILLTLRKEKLPVGAISLIISLAVYLILGAMFSVGAIGDINYGLFFAYGGSIIILLAVGLYASYSIRLGNMLYILLLYRNLSVFASLSVLASPLLYSFFLSVPPSAESRFGGFFGNPNEAGTVGCVAVALMLSIPFRQTWLQYSLSFACSLSVVLTFSKTAWILLPVIYIVSFIRAAKMKSVALMVGGGVVCFSTFIYPISILQWLVNNPYFELSRSQSLRVDQTIAFLTASGESDNVLTGRDYLWKIGWDQIMQTPFWGHGLGSFHFFKEGIFNEGDPQGVHNLYLMVWGEAGFLALLGLVFSTLLIFFGVAYNSRHPVALPLGIILLVNAFVNHNVLSSRYFIAILGVLLAIIARREKRIAKHP